MRNPEEIVRQYVLTLLTSSFGFHHSDIGYEFPLQIGSSQKRADLVVFFKDEQHTQENIFIIIECKRSDKQNHGNALAQLKSYMSASPNATYGVVASRHWRVIEKKLINGRFQFIDIPALVSAHGVFVPIKYDPPQSFPNPAPQQAPPYKAPFANQPTPAPPKQNSNYEKLSVPKSPNESPLPQKRLENNFLGGALALAILLGACICVTTLFSPNENRNANTTNTTVRQDATIFNPRGRPAITGIPTLTTEFHEANALPIPTYETQQAFVTPAFVTFTPQPRATQAPQLETPLPSVPSATPETEASEVVPNASEASTSGVFGVIQANQNVNVRRLASTGANVVGILYPSNRVEIIGENADRTWLEVRLENGVSGWVAAFLVTIETP